MKNKKLTSLVFALTFGLGSIAGATAAENTAAGAKRYSYEYCTALFQSCEYMGNDLACENFDLYC